MKHNRIFTMIILLALVVGSLGVSSRPAVAANPIVCIPTCSETDGRMLSLASVGFYTLAGETISLEIAAPSTMASFDVGIFDGDSGGMWDQGTAPLTYEIFVDPLHNENASGIPYIQWSGNQMTDNAWTTFTVTQSPNALSPSGEYFYHMHVTLPNANLPATATWTSFKVRSNSPIEISTNQAFAYAVPMFKLAEAYVIYPQGFPTNTTSAFSTYDGTWDMYVNVPTSSSAFVLWDGDMDYGSYDCSTYDTNDLDTPDNALPSFASSVSANLEGVATTTIKCKNAAGQVITGPQGQVNTSGNPPDDSSMLPYRRMGSVTYNVITPDGTVYHNGNPSGNQEWEQFRIDDNSGTPADYHVSGLLPAGIYKVHVDNLDTTNLNAWFMSVLCVHADGTPCTPILKPFTIGDTVWFDANGNGIQDNGEFGIPGVKVTLLDSNGQPVPGGTAVTDGNGNYSFDVYAGTYTVKVDASNFNAGGPLEGMTFTTAGGDAQTNVVVNANVLTYDFGLTETFNYCGFIRTPGYWKNYGKHMTDATFLSFLQHTQDFSYLTIAQAVDILGKNSGTTSMGIPALDGTDATFLKFLLAAEINATWNGNDNDPGFFPLFGIGSYQGSTQTINQLLHQAYVDRYNFSAAQMSMVNYLAATGEYQSIDACLVQPLP